MIVAARCGNLGDAGTLFPGSTEPHAVEQLTQLCPVNVRLEASDDHQAVRRVHLASFPGPGEADLVERLRASGDAVLSLVATEGGVLVGHVILSRMSAPFCALGLAPVAVLPDWRRQGIGANLIEEGIRCARRDGWNAVFVLGEPAYYQRFGFSAETAKNFESAYAGPYFMALSLQGVDLPASTGSIDYPPAFAALD